MASVVCLWCLWCLRLFNPNFHWTAASNPLPIRSPPASITRLPAHHHLCFSLSHYLSLPPPHTLAQCLLLLSQRPRSFSLGDWTDSVACACATETGVAGAAARSSEEDKVIESNRMRERRWRVRKMWWWEGWRIAQMDTAPLTFQLPDVSFFFSASFLPLSKHT